MHVLSQRVLSPRSPVGTECVLISLGTLFEYRCTCYTPISVGFKRRLVTILRTTSICRRPRSRHLLTVIYPAPQVAATAAADDTQHGGGGGSGGGTGKQPQVPAFVEGWYSFRFYVSYLFSCCRNQPFHSPGLGDIWP